MPEITDPEDRAVADGLRRAVGTLPATAGDWSGVVRRSRRRRRQEVAMRTGIPALCVAVLAGGAFALGRRSLDGPSVGDRPTTTVASASTTDAPTVLPNRPPTTLPTVATTVPPSATTVVPTVPTEAPATTGASSVPAGPPRPAAAAWPKVGATDAFGTSIGVHATEVGGAVCVGAVALDGTDVGDDACSDGDFFAVMLVGDRLTLVGSGRSDTPVSVTTAAGVTGVATWSFAGRQVYAAVLPAGAELLSVDGSESAADCPYRQLIPALTENGSGSTVDGRRVAVSVERCRGGVAFLRLSAGHEVLQGAAALVERVGGRFEFVALGSDLCNREASDYQRELAACAKVGL